MKQPMNKEQKIQELTERIEKYQEELTERMEKSQAEIDELKKELEKLQKKPYELRYPKNETKLYFISDLNGGIRNRGYGAFVNGDKKLYDIGLYFDTEEEAKQFIKEQTLIKKIKCWVKEQQGDWEPDWSNINKRKYYVEIDRSSKTTNCDWSWDHDKLSKLPHFKTEEIAQACIDEFGDEILEVFC